MKFEIETFNQSSSNIIIVSLYKPPQLDIALFDQKLVKFLQHLTQKHNNNKIILAADWNIDFLKINTNHKIDQFLNNLHSFGFLPVITVPTRITERSATLLDNFFINCSNNVYQTHAIYEDISDHLPILLKINTKNYDKSFSTNSGETSRLGYTFSQINYSNFQHAIANEDWSSLSNDNITSLSPDDNYNFFFLKFKKHFDHAFLNSTKFSNRLSKKRISPG